MKEHNGWTKALARITTRWPGWTVLIVLLITAYATYLARELTVDMQMVNMLPKNSPAAKSYLEIQDRFTDPNTMVALLGPRDRIIEFASLLEPRMRETGDFYYVSGRLPVEFILDHGLMLQKPSDLKRSLATFNNPGLVGVFRGINDDYEKEYTDDEGNLKRDEIEIAHSLLGTHRAFEVLYANLAEEPDAPALEEAVDAMLVGESWNLSLDREMLLITTGPYVSLLDQDELLVMVKKLEGVVDELRPQFPDVEATLIGNAPLQLDETNSLTANTAMLSLIALLIIYLLLARTFRGWILPILALLPLLAGIVWTMALVRIFFETLNLFTAMIMLILIGLGIDFSIHLVSRFYEERAKGKDVLSSATEMIGGTGIGVLTGGLTTATAFMALMIADTQGVFELGVSAATGVIMTLISVFFMLPALLTLREKTVGYMRKRRGIEDSVTHARGAHRGAPLIGVIARFSWIHRVPVIITFAVLIILSVIGAMNNSYLWDLYEMEPAGLRNVEIVRELPDRFGAADQGAWLILNTVEESRAMKDVLRDLPAVGDVSSISDLIPAPEWIAPNTELLERFRQKMKNAPLEEVTEPDYSFELAMEIDRYWDNLDLIGNLAFQSGVDRIVKVIDGITGYNSETDETDLDAILPKLTELLDNGVDPAVVERVSSQWRALMRDRLIRMSNTDVAAIDDLPETFKRTYLPRDGNGGFLMSIDSRKMLFNKEDYMRFTEQVHSVDPAISGSPQMATEMMYETLVDGSEGAALALVAIVILLLIHFRGTTGLIAIIPLLGGAAFMLGMMYLIGMKYNYMNFIAMPIILGIGIDDGVHALHRFRELGKPTVDGAEETFSFVGRAILLSSLTTMIGFGNLAFYAMRGIATFGLLLFMGVGFCFLVSITVLPAVMGFVYDKKVQKNLVQE